MQSVKKIHFINRIDKENIGDWTCSPLQYFFEYFKQYNLLRHDIDFIDYNEIDRDDIVILGGSGLFNVAVSFNEAINKLLEKCDNVIAWSAGFNTHNHQWFQGDKFPEIDFSKFKIVTIRDYNHPSQIEYLPCPSVLAFPNPNYDTTEIKRKIGVIEHKDLPIKIPFAVDKITNNESVKNVFDYIRSSEAIVTNSYHCAYWAQILGRKSIVVNKFSTKFDFYKYKPEFVDISEQDTKETIKIKLEEAFENANIFPQFYQEAVDLNNLFFERVKNVIQSNNVPRNNDYQSFYQLNIPQLWNTQSVPPKLNHRIDDAEQRIKDANQRIDDINQRTDDTNQRIDDTNQRIDDINQRTDDTNQRIGDIDQRIDDINQRTDDTNQRIDDIDQRTDDINQRMNDTNRRMDDTSQKINDANQRIDELQTKIKELTDLKDKPFIHLFVELIKYKLSKK